MHSNSNPKPIYLECHKQNSTGGKQKVQAKSDHISFNITRDNSTYIVHKCFMFKEYGRLFVNLTRNYKFHKTKRELIRIKHIIFYKKMLEEQNLQCSSCSVTSIHATIFYLYKQEDSFLQIQNPKVMIG